MDFNYSAEQLKIQNDTKALAKDQLADEAVKMDQADIAEGAKLLQGQIKKLAGAGLLGVGIPEGDGGAGADLLASCLMIEELANVSPATALSAVYSVATVARVILLFGSDSQKKKYLPGLLKGDTLAGFAYIEPEIGFQFWEFTGKADAEGDGFKLSGKKTMVVNAPEAGVYLVPMYTDSEAGPDKGITLFLIDKDTAGMTIGASQEKVGCRATPTADIEFSDCMVGKDAALGEVGAGWKVLEMVKTYEHLALAACFAGVTYSCVLNGAYHARDTKISGKPAIRNQEISFKISDSLMFHDCARVLVLRAVWLIESGSYEAPQLASLAKLQATESAAQAATWLVQVMGADGLIKGSAAERSYRDSRLGEILGNTSESHRISVAKKVLASA